MRRRVRTSLATLIALLVSSTASGEPLRIIVSPFEGPDSVGQYVMTTLFFEVSRAFTGPARKGVWILYGREPLPELTHRAAILASSWSSVRADVAVWGTATPYGDGVAVQIFLTITPLSEQREVRPEIWSLPVADGDALSLELPRRYYEFEPFALPSELLQAYASPEGVPLYATATGDRVVGHARGAFYFRDYSENGVLLKPRRNRIMPCTKVTEWLPR